MIKAYWEEESTDFKKRLRKLIQYFS